jgi:hypothetical protein
MKKSKIVNNVIVSIILLMFVFLASCSKRSVVDVKKPKKGRIGEEFIVQQNPDRKPKWTKDSEFEVKKENREKVIYVIADITEFKEKRAAERIAEAELRKKIAEGIKTLVQTQFGEVMMGTPDEYKDSFESYVVTVADNIAIVGLIVTDTYWEKIQRIKAKDEVDYYYRVMKRGKMPYENYVTARDKAWQDALNRAVTENEKAEMRRIIEELKRGDEV